MGKWQMKKSFFLLVAMFGIVFGAQSALAQSMYQIRSGDVLRVEVVEDPSLNRDILVLPDGSVNFPFVGALRAAGLTTEQVQQQITAGIASNFAVRPNVFVAVSEVYVAPPAPPFVPRPGPTIDIFIQGEVNAPGLVEVPPGTTLIQALSLHGGFTNFAATRRIQLRRTHPHTGQISVVTLNYRAVSQGATLNHDPVLAEGDVILVPQRRLFE